MPEDLPTPEKSIQEIEKEHSIMRKMGLPKPTGEYAVGTFIAPAAAAPIPGGGRPGRRREADGGAAAEKRRTGQIGRASCRERVFPVV